MSRFILVASFILPFALLAGCTNSGTNTSSSEKEYSLKGRVVSINTEKKTVNIDHEEIPGLMKAMKMDFGVADPKSLLDLVPGQQVEAKLKVVSGKYILSEIRKVGDVVAQKPMATDEEEAEVISNLAKLSAEDRKLAEAQKFCPTGGRLGVKWRRTPRRR
ncbi:MAG: copper-binding protein [Planctomycetes bacterium]|nr:copper-binding protein [Planctomycetota bacterium]